MGYKPLGSARQKRICAALALALAAIAAAGFARIPLARRLVEAAHEQVEAGDYAGAERRYGRALLLAPRLTDAANGLAFCAEMEGRIDRAIETYERSCRTDPWNDTGYVELGRIYLARKRMPARAHECFEKAMQVNPRNLEARRWHITLHRLSGEREQALALCREMLARFPGDSFAMEQMRKLYRAAEEARSAPPAR